MKKVIILSLLFLSGCSDDRKPEAIQETSNTTYSVAKLFEHDDCKVYRFYDKSEYRYFANCKYNTSASWTHEESSITIDANGIAQTSTQVYPRQLEVTKQK